MRKFLAKPLQKEFSPPSRFAYLLRLILEVQEGLGGSLQEEAQFIFANGRWVGWILPLRGGLLVEEFVEDFRARRQNCLKKRQSWVQGCFCGLTHLDGADGLPGVAHEECDVAQLGHRGEELQVVGQARLVLERRLRLVLRQRLASNRIDTEVGHVDCGEAIIQRQASFKVN